MEKQAPMAFWNPNKSGSKLFSLWFYWREHNGEWNLYFQVHYCEGICMSEIARVDMENIKSIHK